MSPWTSHLIFLSLHSRMRSTPSPAQPHLGLPSEANTKTLANRKHLGSGRGREGGSSTGQILTMRISPAQWPCMRGQGLITAMAML